LGVGCFRGTGGTKSKTMIMLFSNQTFKSVKEEESDWCSFLIIFRIFRKTSNTDYFHKTDYFNSNNFEI